MKFSFDRGAELIRGPVRLYGPARSTISWLVLDTGATVSVVSWETLIQIGYDPAVCENRTPITTGTGIEFVPKLFLLDRVRHPSSNAAS